MKSDRLYERMDVTGVTGLSEAQKAMLKLLGAIERDPSMAAPGVVARATEGH
jgi:hypothetical protein